MSSTMKQGFYVGRWNGKSSTVDRVSSRISIADSLSSTATSSNECKSSQLFDNAMFDSDSSPEKPLSRLTHSRTVQSNKYLNDTNVASIEQNSAASCIAENGRERHQTTSVSTSPSPSHLKSSNLQKWGTTSMTRRQINEEMRRQQQRQKIEPDITKFPTFPVSINSDLSRKTKVTHRNKDCKRAKLSVNDRFDLSSDDTLDSTEEECDGEKSEYELNSQCKDSVELNFLGEPVSNSSQSSQYKAPTYNVFSKRDSINYNKYDEDYATQESPKSGPAPTISRNVEISSPINVKKSPVVTKSSRAFCSPDKNRVHVINTKLKINFTEEDKLLPFDSDYFSQSQTSPDVASPQIAPKHIVPVASNEPEPLDEIENESSKPTSPTVEDTFDLCLKPKTYPTSSSPLRDSKKKNFFKLNSNTANRKSPLKARYNARTWVSTSEDGSLTSSQCSEKSTSSIFDVPDDANRNGSPKDPYNISPRCSSQHSNSLKTTGEFDDDFDELVSNNSQNETLCMVKPRNEPFKGLKRISTIPSQTKSSSNTAAIRNNSKLSLLRTHSDSNRFDETKYFSPDTETIVHGAQESIKVSREEKELYLKIRNVKTMHESLEDGESQKFKEDMQYLLEGISPNCPPSTRCLSITSIATKAIQPQFRMQIRAHSILPRISLLLKDVLNTESLSILTAVLFYILSRDKIPLDPDIYSFSLILQLLKGVIKCDTKNENDNMKVVAGEASSKLELAELSKARAKIKKLLTSLDDSSSKLLVLQEEQLTIQSLMVETFLSISNNSQWSDVLKSQIVKHGVVSRIAPAYNKCVEVLLEKDCCGDDTLKKLYFKKLIRCTKFIEALTYCHKENQKLLILEDSSILMILTARAFCYLVDAIKQCHVSDSTSEVNSEQQCSSLESSASHHSLRTRGNQLAKIHSSVNPEVSGDPEEIDQTVGESLQECLMECLRVCLNLTNESELGSTILGNQKNMLSSTIECVLHLPHIVNPDKCFHVTIMSLGLLINLMEYSPMNRRQFMVSKTQKPTFTLPLPQKQDAKKSMSKNGLGSQPSKYEFGSHSGTDDEILAVEALVNLFTSKQKAANQIEEDENLNESNSSADESASEENIKSDISTTDENKDEAAFRSVETRSKRRNVAAIDNLLSSTTLTGATSSNAPSLTNGSKRDDADEPKAAKGIDDEFMDDGEGGLIWIGKNGNGANNSDESGLIDENEEKQRQREERQNIIRRALHVADKHMESCMIAAYVALLIGCILQGNMNNIKLVLQFIPSGNFDGMIEQLERLHKFMGLTTAANTGLLPSISNQISVLKEANQRAVTLDEHF